LTSSGCSGEAFKIHHEKEVKTKMLDLREEILTSVADKRITASIVADDSGIVAGTTGAEREAERLGLSVEMMLNEGSHVAKGDEIARFFGSPKQVLIAEEVLIGLIAKPSGIATAAHKFVKATAGRPTIVCGAWKKMPWSLKDMIRGAVVGGGAFYRMDQHPFIYLDKNYVELFGGIKDSLEAVAHLNDYSKVIQLKGRYKDIVLEACEATKFGANILFIDTGRPNNVKLVIEKLRLLGLRSKVKIAFGGNVKLEDIDELKALDLDILDIGRQIVDAPLLDMRLEIVKIDEN
jgi:nicotinate-nucleotide pyrophosphorylase (carboxylating)